MTKSNGNGHNRMRKDWGAIDPQLLDPHGAMHEGITLPGYEGVPFRGPIPNLKGSDPAHMQPQFGQKLHVEILELWKEPDLKRYREICQVVANEFGMISKEDMQYEKSKGGWRVFIRWMEFYTAVQKGGGNGSSR